MILNTIFSNVEKGTYVDVGACDPYFQSNTQFFYNKGWSGINIDANEISINRFKKIRSRDKNIIVLIHNIEEELEFFFYENPAYNGCIYRENIPSKLLYSKKIRSKTLTDKLNAEKFTNINFLSIDAEGNDFNVLISLDLKKIRPQIIIVESFSKDVLSDLSSEISKYLLNNDYKYFCRTVTNSLYISKEFAAERFR